MSLPSLLRLPLVLLTLTLTASLPLPSRADSPLAPNGPFADSENIKAWEQVLGGKATETSDEKEYSSWLDGRWSYMNRVRMNAMHSWVGSALSGINTSTVFYPFSGPDVLYANTLFPDSKILLMAGLEPVGSMPDLAKLKADGELGNYLGEVKTSLATILSASFFKTKDMEVDFNHEMVNGLLPAIIVFLSREGHSIDNLQFVTLGHDGTVHPKDEGSGSPGVQITYDGGRTILYFDTNLSNEGLSYNPGYIKLMERLGPGVTYLKAASYLLHEDYFSTMRKAILADSDGVVEDDSGIPFKYFDPKEWTVIPYGNYSGPIALFGHYYQRDLADYYAKTSHEPLSFGSGYKFVASVSSLLVAKKK